MNFISKNLGWIMLFLFFLFMLFVISTNQNNSNLNTSTGSTLTESGAIMSDEVEADELNDLVDKLADDEDDEESSEEDEDNEDNEEDTSEGEEEDSEGFFSRLFGKKDEDGNVVEGTGSTQTGTIDEQVNEGDDNTTESTSEVTDDSNETSSDGVVVSSTAGGLSKNTVAVTPVETQYPFRTIGTIPSAKLPGTDLETAVGKYYEIGVYSLKLNNRFFNQTLAYMMKGDVVQQIGEDTNGLFKVRIMTSSNVKNIGKEGFVSKKYLTDTSYTGSGEQVTTVSTPVAVEPTKGDDNRVEVEVTNIPTTVTEAPISKEYFNPTDSMQLKDGNGRDIALMGHAEVLRKISTEDSSGCFRVKIVGSNYCDNHGLEGYVCRADIKSYTPAQD